MVVEVRAVAEHLEVHPVQVVQPPDGLNAQLREVDPSSLSSAASAPIFFCNRYELLITIKYLVRRLGIL